jgi:hypothetical protein
MKFKTIALTLILMIPPATSRAYYYNVDSKSGGLAQSSITGGSVDTSPFTQMSIGNFVYEVTNTGQTDLTDVGLVWLFSYDADTDEPFTYSNSHHRWEYSDRWLMFKTGGVFLSMSRSITDLPLVWDRGASLLETDEVPVGWIGDLAAGQTATVGVGFEAYKWNDAYFDTLVVSSSVPEPSTVCLLALGCLVLRRKG